MNWNNLKNYKCPKDASPLKDIGHYHACTKTGCVFSINKEKFDQIVNDINKPKAKRCGTFDNQEALNNL